MARILTVLLALSLAACGGGGDGKPDAGNGPEADPAYWGLGDGLCLRYDDGKGNLRYTIEIHADETTMPGVKAFELRHKWQGFLQRTDLVEVTSDSVLLHRRTTGGFGGQDTLYRYDPAPVLLRKGLEEGSPQVESVTNASLSGSETRQEQQTFRVAALQEEEVDGPGGKVTAQFLNVSVEAGEETTVERIWFAPDVGIVKLDPPGPDIEEVTLKESNPIPDEGCLSE